MSRFMKALLVAALLIGSLSVPLPARAQGVGNCLLFGAWVIEQGGEVYEVRTGLTAGFCFILFSIYGVGTSMPCQCG